MIHAEELIENYSFYISSTVVKNDNSRFSFSQHCSYNCPLRKMTLYEDNEVSRIIRMNQPTEPILENGVNSRDNTESPESAEEMTRDASTNTSQQMDGNEGRAISVSDTTLQNETPSDSSPTVVPPSHINGIIKETAEQIPQHDALTNTSQQIVVGNEEAAIGGSDTILQNEAPPNFSSPTIIDENMTDFKRLPLPSEVYPARAPTPPPPPPSPPASGLLSGDAINRHIRSGLYHWCPFVELIYY